MKIRDVKTYRLDAVLAEPFAYSQAWYNHRGALLVEILGEDGSSGWGEAFGPPLLTAAKQSRRKTKSGSAAYSNRLRTQW